MAGHIAALIGVVVVLRVTTLYASTAAVTAGYYTAYLTEAEDEIPGRWTGGQAALHGLAGPVGLETRSTTSQTAAVSGGSGDDDFARPDERIVLGLIKKRPDGTRPRLHCSSPPQYPLWPSVAPIRI